MAADIFANSSDTDLRKKWALMQLKNGTDMGPAPGPIGALAKALQGSIGGYMAGQAEADDKKAGEDMFNSLPGISPSGSAQTPQTSPQKIASTLRPTLAPGLDQGINNAAEKYGIDPNYLRTTAHTESSGGINNSKPLSSAKGPFAFIDSTAKQYGLTNPMDPGASADAAARFAVDNKTALTQALGREPTNGELYLAHQQGAGGAIKLLKNPDAPAVNVIGQRALINNGGSPAMTSAQFAQGFTRRFDQPQMAVNSVLPPNAKPAGPAATGQPAPPAMPPAGAQMAQNGPPGVMPPQAQNAPAPNRSSVQIPPDVQETIKRLGADPRTRPQALQLYMQYAKPVETIQPMTLEQRKQWNVPEGMSAGIDVVTGKPTFSPPQTNIALNTAQKGQEVMATHAAEEFKTAQEAGRDATKRVQTWDNMEKAAQGFRPGATAEVRLQTKRYLKDLGIIDGEDVPDGEVLKQAGRQLAIHAQPKGQGSVSNYERGLYASAMANIEMSPEALSRAIQMGRKLDDFDRKVAQVYRDNARKNGGVPNSIDINEEIDKLGAPLGQGDMNYLRKNGGDAKGAGGAEGQPTAPSQPGIRKYNPATGKIE